MTALVGEVQQRDELGAWRTVRLGSVPVTDRRRSGAGDPLGPTPEGVERSGRWVFTAAATGMPQGLSDVMVQQ